MINNHEGQVRNVRPELIAKDEGVTHMSDTTFVVRVNWRGPRAPEYVQRINSTPIRMTTTRKLALLKGRFTAEDAVRLLQNARCIPELESVQISA